MTLAARLDRLRSATATTVKGTAAPPGPAPAGVRQSAERLAVALSGRCLSDGLVCSETCHAIGQGATGIPFGDDLPETRGLGQTSWLYLDTETTGLSGGTGNLAFMVGLARYERAGLLRVRQYTLSGFDAERAMLSALDEWVERDTVIVSYNGRSFDVPLLTGRLRLNRLADRLATLPHLDLMHTVRRAYRDTWPDCRLQTAEQRRLGLRRVDDLPGAEAPMAWRTWLRGGRLTELSRVLIHNRQDLVSLALLHAAMTADYAQPGDQADVRRIGRAWQSAGATARGIRLWQRHRERLDEAGQLELAAAYRRAGQWRDAEQVWLALYREGSREAACALSKYHEHRRRDYRRALVFARASVEPGKASRVRRLLRKLGDSGAGSNLELPLATAVGERTQGFPAVSMK